MQLPFWLSMYFVQKCLLSAQSTSSPFSPTSLFSSSTDLKLKEVRKLYHVFSVIWSCSNRTGACNGYRLQPACNLAVQDICNLHHSSERARGVLYALLSLSWLHCDLPHTDALRRSCVWAFIVWLHTCIAKGAHSLSCHHLFDSINSPVRRDLSVAQKVRSRLHVRKQSIQQVHPWSQT
jgi:hypothetical protein